MSEKVALVTGGSEGLGAACVRRLLHKGWKVASLSLTDSAPDGALAIAGDVTSADARRDAVSQTVARFGRVDLLVNNAAVGLYAPPSTVDVELTKRLFDVNVFGALAMAQQVVPVMLSQGGGTIVNVGSVGGLVSLPWAVVYCASKFALHAIDDSLYRELHPKGIRVIKICPGIIQTRFRENVLAGKAPDRVAAIDRVVTADSVAASIVQAVERGRRTVYVPKIGRIFTAMGILTPWLMDWYLARQWRPRAD
jgi:NAD(P)-dependent dehydrogenase (short-subunit alcohol dehydrogenase family)